jgi:hypothetical protein
MRRFVRHPADIPIQIQACDQIASPLEECPMTDVSQGGLCCCLDYPIEIGKLVDVHIQSVRPEYHGRGEVAWCKQDGDHFEIGIRFQNVQEAFKSRMVQQVCQIEQYKNFVFQKEGRILDGNQAAEEWIRKYATEFPR